MIIPSLLAVSLLLTGAGGESQGVCVEKIYGAGLR